MTPHEAMAAARRAGATLSVTAEGKLHVDGWRKLPLDVKRAIRSNKPAIVAALQRKSTMTDADAAAPGLTRLNGIWTHPLGDKFAADVLSGKVPRDEALAMEQRANRERHAAHRKWNP